MKSSTKKIYFNKSSEGDVEQLRILLLRHPQLLSTKNQGSGYLGIFYSVKNLKEDATKYFIKSGLSITHSEINKLIDYEWYGSLRSYFFLLEIGSSICIESRLFEHIDFKSWLQKKYINCYYKHRNVDRLIKFLESTSKEKIDWQKQLDDYLTYTNTPSNRNANHLQFVRELKLRTLI